MHESMAITVYLLNADGAEQVGHEHREARVGDAPRDDNEIVAGHGRVEAAKLLGRESVPALRLSHLSEAERRAYVIADNKLALNAGWDREMLAIELQALVDLDFDVELTGFSLAEVDLVLDGNDPGRSFS